MAARMILNALKMGFLKKNEIGMRKSSCCKAYRFLLSKVMKNVKTQRSSDFNSRQSHEYLLNNKSFPLLKAQFAHQETRHLARNQTLLQNSKTPCRFVMETT
jgi:hypothetical protein